MELVEPLHTEASYRSIMFFVQKHRVCTQVSRREVLQSITLSYGTFLYYIRHNIYLCYEYEITYFNVVKEI